MTIKGGTSMTSSSAIGRTLRAIVLVTVLALSGCGLFEEIRSYTNVDGGRFTIEEEKDYSTSANYRKTSKAIGFFTGSTNYVRETNLAEVIFNASNSPDTPCSKALNPGECLSLAEKQFQQTYVTVVNGKQIDKNGWIVRNIIQERLIMASNSACREFTQHLNTFQASSNFLLGAAAVGTGAAGAIVTAATAARALAGTTGALSGTRAELNADIFENKFVPVITRSIDDRRRTFLSALRGYEVPSGMRPLPETENNLAPAAAPSGSVAPGPGGKPSSPTEQIANSLQSSDWQRCPEASSNVVAGQNEMNAEYQLPPNGYQCLPLQRYPLEAAIADAIYYNDLCSLDKGLENIQVALDIAKHPGLDDLAAAQDTQNQLLKKQLESLDLEKQKTQKEQEIAQLQTPPSGTSISKTVAVNPTSIAFGSVKVGFRSRSRKITLTNGTDSSVKITGPIQPLAPFSIVPGRDGCSNTSLPSGRRCTVLVQFAPTRADHFAIGLTITDDTTGTHNVTLTGKGT
jgi:Abnormal spindle-like microcephaly-assoc'd, ASPM-SPD-2-Hydin